MGPYGWGSGSRAWRGGRKGGFEPCGCGSGRLMRLAVRVGFEVRHGRLPRERLVKLVPLALYKDAVDGKVVVEVLRLRYPVALGGADIP